MRSFEEVWADYQAVGSSWPVLRELVYTLFETIVEDENGVPRVLWEVTRLGRDTNREFLPQSPTWAEFVRDHFGIHKTTASKYKRLWEVYHVKLGYGVGELASRSVYALGKAVAKVDRLRKAGAVAELAVMLEKLFGDFVLNTYFIADEHLRVKIGVSMNVFARLASMGPSNVDGLILLHVFDGDREVEFHEMFALSRICGEWFNLSYDMARFLVDSGCDKIWCAGGHGWGYGDYATSFEF